MKRIGTFVTAAFAVFTLALSLAPRATAQDVVLDDGPKQRLTIVYGHDGILLSGTGEDAVKYKGIVYVTVFPITPRLKKKYGDDPIFSDELQCGVSANHASGDDIRIPNLPFGKYEVHFSMRDGDDLKTCIKSPIILSAEDSPTVMAEFGNAKTLVIGGDITFQQMEGYLVEMAKRIAELQAEVDALKGKAGAAPAK